MATKRRGPGDARVFKAADGRWYTFVELHAGPDGKRRRKKLSAKTQGQVVAKRNEALKSMQGAEAPND